MGSTWRTAWGRTTWRKLAARLKPRADAASHWPLFTAWIPVFRVPATDTAKITEKEITATATGSMSEEAKMTKFTMRSTTRLGTPSMIRQKSRAAPDTALRRLRSTRHRPKPSAVPKSPDNREISRVTSRPLRIICQRFSRMKVFSKLSITPSRKPSDAWASVLATTMTVRTVL